MQLHTNVRPRLSGLLAHVINIVNKVCRLVAAGENLTWQLALPRYSIGNYEGDVTKPCLRCSLFASHQIATFIMVAYWSWQWWQLFRFLYFYFGSHNMIKAGTGRGKTSEASYRVPGAQKSKWQSCKWKQFCWLFDICYIFHSFLIEPWAQTVLEQFESWMPQQARS